MAKDKAYASRLKGGTSFTDDSNGYDLLGHVRDAGLFFATGQVPTQKTGASDLDTQLKLQRLQTGNPDFIREQNALKLKTEFDNKLAQEKAMIEEKRRRQQEAGFGGPITPSGGASFGVQPSNDVPSTLTQGSPVSQMSGGKKPAFITVEGKKFDAETGVTIPDYQVKENPDYLTPEEEKQMATKNEMLRSEGLSQLQALRGAKKGADFFGPMGGELPSTLGGFPNPFVGTTYPGNSKINDRTDWEANLENLKATKMIETMMKMKDASKTGATGFGQLSEKEGQVLMDASMKLRRNLDPAQAKVYIDQMEAIKMKELGMPLSPEQQMILEQINSGTYPSTQSSPMTESSVPSVGGTFQGKPIKNVRRIG